MEWDERQAPLLRQFLNDSHHLTLEFCIFCPEIYIPTSGYFKSLFKTHSNFLTFQIPTPRTPPPKKLFFFSLTQITLSPSRSSPGAAFWFSMFKVCPVFTRIQWCVGLKIKSTDLDTSIKFRGQSSVFRNYCTMTEYIHSGAPSKPKNKVLWNEMGNF